MHPSPAKRKDLYNWGDYSVAVISGGTTSAISKRYAKDRRKRKWGLMPPSITYATP